MRGRVCAHGVSSDGSDTDSGLWIDLYRFFSIFWATSVRARGRRKTEV